jgi:LPS sulfotransferase NodH
MAINSDVIVVTGLPRSGTSLMMQMLDRGGIEIVTDHVRTADADNPRGYYEFEPVKAIERDASWLPAARGKAVKMVSFLLYHLPPTERYRFILMERNLDEVLASQEKMLQRLGRNAAASRDEMKRSFELHLAGLNRWLARQSHAAVLRISYHELMATPQAQALRLCDFLDRQVNADRMLAAIDPQLYRNRQAATAP